MYFLKVAERLILVRSEILSVTGQIGGYFNMESLGAPYLKHIDLDTLRGEILLILSADIALVILRCVKVTGDDIGGLRYRS